MERKHIGQFLSTTSEAKVRGDPAATTLLTEQTHSFPHSLQCDNCHDSSDHVFGPISQLFCSYTLFKVHVVHQTVHSSTICKSPRLETTQSPTDNRTDK